MVFSTGNCGIQHEVDSKSYFRVTTFPAFMYGGMLAHDGMLVILGAENHMDMRSSASICLSKQAFTLCSHDVRFHTVLGHFWLDMIC